MSFGTPTSEWEKSKEKLCIFHIVDIKQNGSELRLHALSISNIYKMAFDGKDILFFNSCRDDDNGDKNSLK